VLNSPEVNGKPDLRFAVTLGAMFLLSSLSAVHAQNPVVGVWELQSIVDESPTGQAPQWMGEHPTGLIVYTPNGRISAQFMRDPRPTFSSPAWSADGEQLLPSSQDSEVRSVLAGYYAYFGTYDVDMTAQTIVHHVRGSLRPNEVGIDYTRRYEVSGDILILTVGSPAQGRTRRLTWRRIPE